MITPITVSPPFNGAARFREELAAEMHPEHPQYPPPPPRFSLAAILLAFFSVALFGALLLSAGACVGFWAGKQAARFDMVWEEQQPGGSWKEIDRKRLPVRIP